MADVTVKQLADTVGAPVDRLLKQMKEAGLEHKSEGDAVTEEQKQVLLGFLKRSHGEAAKPAEKIVLKRKSTGTLKSGQGRAGRNVTVEVRRKRTYVKRSEVEAAEKPVAEEEAVSQSELEAKRIRDEEAARIQAEEDARQAELQRKEETERKAAEEKQRQEEEQRLEQERLAAAQKAEAEAEAKK
ncbi:MAG TPA: translation initiation factor IF-2, partial [Gammaproteobacteria bacterium]|nr:translation initiation factor IF-2 [Gammaproteobacteria bacterium]